MVFSFVLIIFANSFCNCPIGLTSIHQNCLSYNSIQQKSLSYNSIHQVYGKNACHTNFILFRKTLEKKLNHFCGFLRTVEQRCDKKTDLIFFIKNSYHIIFITTQKFFSIKFENLSQIFFCFFFQPQIKFCTQTNIFRKKNFACKI